AADRNALDRTVQSEASTLQERITMHLQERIHALERMAKRWEADRPDQAAWEKDAMNYVQDFRDYQAVEWITPSSEVAWIAPRKGNEAVSGMRLAAEARGKESLALAQSQRRAVVSRPVSLGRAGKGCLLLIPLYPQKRFGGYIGGVVRFQTFFDRLLT